MRFLLFSLLLCAALMGSPALAETIRVLVQRSPLAGSQYYAANAVWTRIRVGDRLTLVREADNRHDRRAVRVEWQGQQLGYVPRAENRAVSHALDAGERLKAVSCTCVTILIHGAVSNSKSTWCFDRACFHMERLLYFSLLFLQRLFLLS